MQRSGTLYTVLFAAAVCACFSVLVATSAVTLKDLQDRNKLLYKQTNVLSVAGLLEQGENLSGDEVMQRFNANIETRIVDLDTGEYVDENVVDPASYDQTKAAKDPEMSMATEKNRAQVPRVPKYAAVYLVKKDGEIDMLVLPVEGKGLWSTMRGFLAVDNDLETVRGLTFYSHGETPGLGGEIDNPIWKAKWPGRKIYDEDGDVALEVVKGSVGPPEEAPYKVDGLSGATLTSNGVTYLIDFWMGETGFKPYLDKVRSSGGIA